MYCPAILHNPNGEAGCLVIRDVLQVQCLSETAMIETSREYWDKCVRHTQGDIHGNWMNRKKKIAILMLHVTPMELCIDRVKFD